MNILRKTILIGLIASPLVAIGADSFTPSELESLFFSDIGPSSLNVSSYPKDKQEEYKVFSKICSQCHTLARAINSTTVSRKVWEYYVFRMRMWMEPSHQARYTREEAEQIVEFLAYDSKLRKVDRRDDFDAATRNLQIRFKDTIDERVRRLRTGPNKLGIERLDRKL